MPFNPAVLDGRGTRGISPPQQVKLGASGSDSPPYVGFGVTCGITFTFGGLRVDLYARPGARHVGPPARSAGLYAAGELVGGLFINNYPGGTGLMSGAVFGRRAGYAAAASALSA